MSDAATPPATAREEFQRLSVLIAASFVDMVGFAIVLPLIPFYATRLQATPLQVGWIIAAFSVAQSVAAPVWGYVSDHYGRRPALLIGLLASSAAFLVFGLADSLWLLFLSRLVQGAGGGTTGVMQAYVADTIAPAQRARALGWLSAATSAGVMLGPALGSLSTNLGRSAPGFVASALCLANAFFAWKWLPESRPRGTGAAVARRSPWRAMGSVLREPASRVARLLWIYAVGMLAFTALTSVLALYLQAEFGVTERTIGYVFLYVGGLSVVMRVVLLGPIIDRIGETRAMRVGAAALVVGLLLYPVARSPWALALIMPLVPIGTALLFPATTSLVSRYSAPGETGTVMGVAQTLAGLARIVAPVVATWSFQVLGHQAPFLVAAALVAVVSLLARGIPVEPARRAAPPGPV